jgi:hypothetical protein
MLAADVYRDRVEIETRTEPSGTFHENAGDWSLLATRWCRRTQVSSQYAMVLAQRGHEERVERLLFRGEMEFDIANTRFVLSGRYYRAIEPCEHDAESDETTVLIAQEVQR